MMTADKIDVQIAAARVELLRLDAYYIDGKIEAIDWRYLREYLEASIDHCEDVLQAIAQITPCA